jgi:hypothetical protein
MDLTEQQVLVEPYYDYLIIDDKTLFLQLKGKKNAKKRK